MKMRCGHVCGDLCIVSGINSIAQWTLAVDWGRVPQAVGR